MRRQLCHWVLWRVLALRLKVQWKVELFNLRVRFLEFLRYLRRGLVVKRLWCLVQFIYPLLGCIRLGLLMINSFYRRSYRLWLVVGAQPIRGGPSSYTHRRYVLMRDLSLHKAEPLLDLRIVLISGA
jgi:hypothetical protein